MARALNSLASSTGQAQAGFSRIISHENASEAVDAAAAAAQKGLSLAVDGSNEVAHEAIDATTAVVDEARGALTGMAAIFDLDDQARGIVGDSRRRSVGGTRRGFVKTLGTDVDIDDDDVVLVVTFPCEPPKTAGQAASPKNDSSDSESEDTEAGDQGRAALLCTAGPSPEVELVEDPFERAKEIFPESSDEELEQRFGDEPLSQFEYMDKVCQMVIHIVKDKMQMRIQTFDSIDKDEKFVKISADDKVIEKLASIYGYKLPFNNEAYSKMERSPPKDTHGEEVLAYHEFTAYLKGKLKGFEDVDKIRLLTSHLEGHMRFERMTAQGAKFFPAAKYDDVGKLSQDWGRLSRCIRNPRMATIDKVRGYFGEEIGFFFGFFAYYIKWLWYLAIVAIIAALPEFPFLEIPFQYQNIIKLGFGVCLVSWATTFQMSFEHQSARSKQRWGMSDYDSKQQRIRADYEQEKDGTKQQKCASFGAKVIMLLYMLFFAVVWTFVQTQIPDKVLKSYASTGLTFLFSFVWSGQFAKRLVQMQNHRTQARMNNALVQTIAFVKIFLYLLPLIKVAFFADVIEARCYPTLQQGLDHIYWGNGTAAWGEPTKVAEWPTFHHIEEWQVKEQADVWMKEYTFNVGPYSVYNKPIKKYGLRPLLNWMLSHGLREDDEVCFFGCLPTECDMDSDQESAFCMTTCYDTLQTQLRSLYISHVVFTVIFLVIPILQTNHRARMEMKVVGNRAYSWLQYQAKCEKYEYYSWGGSYVEDFMEVVLGFALLACFGIISPTLVIIAYGMQLVEYRLLAYRMVNVTSRPFPEASEGIGTWHTVIEVVLVLAANINAGLAVFRMRTPFRRWESEHKVIAFFAISYCLMGLRLFLRVMYPHTPGDVARVSDVNSNFQMKLAEREIDKAEGSSADPSSPVFTSFAPGSLNPAPGRARGVQQTPQFFQQ